MNHSSSPPNLLCDTDIDDERGGEAVSMLETAGLEVTGCGGSLARANYYSLSVTRLTQHLFAEAGNWTGASILLEGSVHRK